MKRGPFPYHVQHNAVPEALKGLLRTCSNGVISMQRLADELQIGVGTVQHIVPFARQCGLVQDDRLSLTGKGEEFYQLVQQFPTLFPEAVHHLLYTDHRFDSSKRFSWAYAQVVDAVWASGERKLDGLATAQLVGMVVDRAAQEFGSRVDEIAFSQRSVGGIINWLRALDPPCVTDTGARQAFRRRYFCPERAFLWAVDSLYRASRTAYGVRVFLNPERVERLCRSCVIDPSGFDNVLMMAKRLSDYERGGIFDHGTEGGFGRWLLLARGCPVPTTPS